MLDITQDYILKSINAATIREMFGYVTTANANRAWIDWRVGDLKAAESYGREALKGWGQVAFVFSFQWTALWPLIAIAVEKGQL